VSTTIQIPTLALTLARLRFPILLFEDSLRQVAFAAFQTATASGRVLVMPQLMLMTR
jgi:hypothetical protein